MKNALIKPVLSLKNKDLLLDWWKKVEGGDVDAPLPPESEIFKSEHYSSFIYLFFKMATEVNVFAHLGKTLFSHMKESLFSDVKESDSEDEDEIEEEQDEAQDKSVSESLPKEDNTLVEENRDASIDKQDNIEYKKDSIAEAIAIETESAETKPKPTKTVTSMYGKVYTIKSE
eukprot:GFUD01033083.1.p1 GENE.GFUD01033083.1~~GFUD01033083.1.p1  ORF type:complete len:173 (-),score=52.86 GFUD01033083.1:226-744(-)